MTPLILCCFLPKVRRLLVMVLLGYWYIMFSLNAIVLLVSDASYCCSPVSFLFDLRLFHLLFCLGFNEYVWGPVVAFLQVCNLCYLLLYSLAMENGEEHDSLLVFSWSYCIMYGDIRSTYCYICIILRLIIFLLYWKLLLLLSSKVVHLSCISWTSQGICGKILLIYFIC